MEPEIRNLGKVSVTVEGEHNFLKEYNRLSLVKITQDNGIACYISKRRVPKRISILDTKYWMPITKADESIKPVNEGLLTLIQGGTILGTFSANSDTDVEIQIPESEEVNDGKLTIKANGETVGTFSANESTDKTINLFIPTNANDVYALPASTKYAKGISVSMNPSTYVVTFQLIDQDGNDIGFSQSIDLPLESILVDGEYNSVSKKIILELDNGNYIEIPIGDLISGLQTEITTTNKLSADLIQAGSTNKIYTSAEKTKLASLVEVSGTYTDDNWTKITIDGVEKNIPQGGGGSSSSLSDLNDVNFTSLANGQMLKYNSTSQKWENVDIPSNAFICTLTETTVDDTTIYSCDKTVAEINAADNAGKVVLMKTDIFTLSLTIAESSGASFSAFFVSGLGVGIGAAYGTNDGVNDSWTFGLTGMSNVAFSGDYSDLSNLPTLGTAAALDVAASGNASTTQVVKGDDTRLAAEVFVCTYTTSPNTVDKTPQEIYEAYQSGKFVICELGGNEMVLTTCIYSSDSDIYGIRFCNFYNPQNTNPQIHYLTYLGTLDSGSWSHSVVNLQKELIGSGTGQNIKTVNGNNLLGSGDISITASGINAIPSSEKGANGGVAELDSNGKVPSSQLPSYVDDVLEYASQSAFPATGESGKIYIALDTNKTYRWSGSAYAEISESLALGETSSTAYRGDRGKTAYDHSQVTDGSNPHNTTFANIANKPTTISGYGITDAFSGSYDDLTNKPTIPDAVSGTNDGTNWTSLTIGSVTKNIPSGGGGGLTNYDFTHTANQSVSGSVTITFAANQRGSQMITVSADIGITFDVRNLSDNYLWIKNTGSSDIDVTISSVVNDQTTVSNVYVPADGISVPAGGICEIGIVRNADGAFITSRNDLEL